MNKYLPNKNELKPIVNDRTTFYDCGFNIDFELLPFKKKLEIINNLVRQSIVPTSRPMANDTETLIGNCHTAAKVSMNYLKQLGLGEEIYYVFARRRSFDPIDVTTTHAILLVKEDNDIYQFDATPYVGYKYGCVEEIHENKWYEEYIEIDDEMSDNIEILKEIIYTDYNEAFDIYKLEYYLEKMEKMKQIKILNGYLAHAYNSILKHIRLDNERKKIEETITQINPYDKRNVENFKYKNKLVVDQVNKWKYELNNNKNLNLKNKLELAQNIVQELKFVYPEIEKYILLNGKKMRLSTITPRVLMENKLNVVMIKPSAYYLGVDNYIRERLDLGDVGLCEYTTNLGVKTLDTGLEPMLFSHTVGNECIREYTGKNNIMFSKMSVEELKKRKKEIRKMGSKLNGKEVMWYDDKLITWSPFTTNLVHTTDNYAEAALHYLMGYPEHQLMTRFMYPNLKLERIR